MADLLSRASDSILQAHKHMLCFFTSARKRLSIAWRIISARGDVKSVSSGSSLIIVVKRWDPKTGCAAGSLPGVHPRTTMVERGTLHFAPYRPKAVHPVDPPSNETPGNKATLEDILE